MYIKYESVFFFFFGLWSSLNKTEQRVGIINKELLMIDDVSDEEYNVYVCIYVSGFELRSLTLNPQSSNLFSWRSSEPTWARSRRRRWCSECGGVRRRRRWCWPKALLLRPPLSVHHHLHHRICVTRLYCLTTFFPLPEIAEAWRLPHVTSHVCCDPCTNPSFGFGYKAGNSDSSCL